VIKYCHSCGGVVTHRIPEGDSLQRAVCDACGTIHYQNPKMVVGCLATYGDRILISTMSDRGKTRDLLRTGRAS